MLLSVNETQLHKNVGNGLAGPGRIRYGNVGVSSCVKMSVIKLYFQEL